MTVSSKLGQGLKIKATHKQVNFKLAMAVSSKLCVSYDSQLKALDRSTL